MRAAISLLLLAACSKASEPRISVIPDRLDLGRMVRGEMREVRLRIENMGNPPLLIDTIVASDEALTIDALYGIEFPRGGSMQAIVRYTAEEIGPIDAHLSIVSGAGVAEIPVSGMVNGTEIEDAGDPDAAEKPEAGSPEDAGVDAGATPCVPVFGNPVPLAGTGTNAGLEEDAAIVAGENGTWISVFASDDDLGGQIGDEYDLFFSRTTDGGATWSYARPLVFDFSANDVEIDDYVAIAYGGGGTWIATWQADVHPNTDPAFVYASISTDDGATFSTPILLASEEDDAEPAIATDGTTWIVAWHAHHTLAASLGRDGDINFVRSTDAGRTWSAIGAINDHAPVDGSWDGWVSLATIGPNAFIALWTSNHDGAGYGPDDDVLVSRTFDGGETWEPARPLLADPTESNAESDAAIAADRNGRIVVAWPVDDVNETLMAATSLDGGDTWIVQAAATDAPEDAEVSVATDGAGTFLIAWHSHADIAGNGTDGDIVGVLSRDGGLTWEPKFLLNRNGTSDISDDATPRVASDGNSWLLIYEADAPRDLLYVVRGSCE